MKRNLLFIAVILIFSISNTKAQVGGISASKLATINAEPVPHKMAELEPSFTTDYSSSFYDENGKLIKSFENNDSIRMNSALGFRITYGVMNCLEIGASLPSSADEISFGLKYNFINKEKIAFSILLGLNTVLNKTVSKTDRLYEESNLYAFGYSCTWLTTGKLSVDMDG